jgi:hypothetical protein
LSRLDSQDGGKDYTNIPRKASRIRRSRILAAVLTILTVSSMLAAIGPQFSSVYAQSSLVTGINYMSAGNIFSDSDSQLNADFARFANDGIKHISMRLIWSTLEPTYDPQTSGRTSKTYTGTCHAI